MHGQQKPLGQQLRRIVGTAGVSTIYKIDDFFELRRGYLASAICDFNKSRKMAPAGDAQMEGRRRKSSEDLLDEEVFR